MLPCTPVSISGARSPSLLPEPRSLSPLRENSPGSPKVIGKVVKAQIGIRVIYVTTADVTRLAELALAPLQRVRRRQHRKPRGSHYDHMDDHTADRRNPEG